MPAARYRREEGILTCWYNPKKLENTIGVHVDYEITKGRMDDVFLEVTGKKLVGGDQQ